MPDPHTAWQSLFNTAAELQRQLLATVAQPFNQGAGPIDAGTVLRELADDFVRDPQRWQALQQNWYQQQWALWQTAVSNNPPPADPAPADRRFRAPEWREPYFAWLARSYLSTSQWLSAIAEDATLAPAAKRKAAFLVRQWVDAASPANFGWSNPEALKLAVQTEGASVAQGLQNLRNDLPKGMVSMTDEQRL